MKTFLFALLAVAAVTALPVEQEHPEGEGWYVPQPDGTFEWVSRAEWEQAAVQPQIEGRATTVTYYLYTKSNPSTPQTITADASTLSSSNFNKAHPTRVVIHGWNSAADTAVCYNIRDALLAVGEYNVICVDWSKGADTLNYAASVLRVPGVGKQVAALLDFLSTQGMSFDTLIVAGHSLGAHVSGFAGKNVSKGKIFQITGMDPAYPLYSYDKPADRLNENDAQYVESIQTCGGLLGFLQPIGKGAFYPNGGKTQPGCGLDLAGTCAHSRSYEYYAEAIKQNNFPSIKCASYTDAVDKACGSTFSSIKMGAYSNYVNAIGDFYVPVNKKAPFGMGSS